MTQTGTDEMYSKVKKRIRPVILFMRPIKRRVVHQSEKRERERERERANCSDLPTGLAQVYGIKYHLRYGEQPFYHDCLACVGL